MIRIELDANAVTRTRFAISALGVAADLLYAVICRPGVLERRWRELAEQTLRAERLTLLVAVCANPDGAPDFLIPAPGNLHPDLDAELHQVATISSRRLQAEMSFHLRGGPTSAPPRLLLAELDKGEEHFAGRIAWQLHRFWTSALAPSWADLHARLQQDVSYRAVEIATGGMASAINSLDESMDWADGGVHVHLRHRTAQEGVALSRAEQILFVPSIFAGGPCVSRDCTEMPEERQPMILYPALPHTAALPSEDLIGATRARILAELTRPATTGELAARLHLTTATISYHLQILFRAGLVQRNRRNRHLLYQRSTARIGA